MKKATLLVVDTDSGFCKRFDQRLRIEDIAEKYQVRMLEPDTTSPPSEMANKVVVDAARILSEEDVCAIFVDLVIYERAPFDTDGIRIANGLRNAFPHMPIFNISSKSSESEAAHMDHFAEATLGSTDGVFPKSFLEGDTFSAKRLAQILRRGKEKRDDALFGSGRASEPNAKSISIPPGARELFNLNALDGRVAAQIEEVGSGAFWGLLLRLMPNAEGVVSYIAPGASGAYVFKAKVKFKQPGTSATGAKQFLIKVATGEGALLAEARHRKELVRTPVSRDHFPNLFGDGPIDFGGLCGIAYEFETDHDTLLAYLARELGQGSLVPGLGKNLVGILSQLYGDSELRVKAIWSDCYSLPPSARTKLLGYLAENKPLLRELVGVDVLRKVENFVLHGGATLGQLEKEIDTRQIHGDFNCGNILINATDGHEPKISVIDLGSRRQDHIIRDVAKLERDIIFRVFDWGSAKYHDPCRLPLWRSFLLTLSIDALFCPESQPTDDDSGVVAAKGLIYELRTTIRAVDAKSDGPSYQIALLHYSLLAMLHPKISTAKKAFAIEYVAQIIDELQC